MEEKTLMNILGNFFVSIIFSACTFEMPISTNNWMLFVENHILL